MNFGSYFEVIGKVLLVMYVHLRFEGQRMKRVEAVALLKELSAEHLIQPSSVLIEQRKPDSYQLCLKGDFDRQGIEDFLQKHTLMFEEDSRRGFCIFES
jgi:hypothetical protein